MNFVLEPQPNDEGDGEANNHTSEALNKTLDHAMLVRTFIAHRTHQELHALQSTGDIASDAPPYPIQRNQRPARPSLNSSPILRAPPQPYRLCMPPASHRLRPPTSYPLRPPAYILCARHEPILCARQPIFCARHDVVKMMSQHQMPAADPEPERLDETQVKPIQTKVNNKLDPAVPVRMTPSRAVPCGPMRSTNPADSPTTATL